MQEQPCVSRLRNSPPLSASQPRLLLLVESAKRDRQTAARPDEAADRRKTCADVTLARPELWLRAFFTRHRLRHRLCVNPADSSHHGEHSCQIEGFPGLERDGEVDRAALRPLQSLPYKEEEPLVLHRHSLQYNTTTLDIEHRASNIKHRTSNIEHSNQRRPDEQHQFAPPLASDDRRSTPVSHQPRQYRQAGSPTSRPVP